jgi:hypothetical protein
MALLHPDRNSKVVMTLRTDPGCRPVIPVRSGVHRRQLSLEQKRLDRRSQLPARDYVAVSGAVAYPVV